MIASEYENTLSKDIAVIYPTLESAKEQADDNELILKVEISKGD